MGARTHGVGNGKAAATGERAEDGTTVFRGTAYSPLRTTVALALWLGAIHFNAFLVLASLFLFPRRVAALYALASPPPPLILPGSRSCP
jgi:diacylglycerol O-acyltransferase 2, plant